eukprot:SAG11_NODE_628_length_8077_cov_4.820632_7_plen_293_part_00
MRAERTRRQYTLTRALTDVADAMHAANPASVVAYSSPTWLSTYGDRRCDPQFGGHCEPNYQPGPRLNTTHSVDWVTVAKHFDMLQPMEYCSLDNGTAPCAPLYWVNSSLHTYKGAGIPRGKAMPIFPWIGPAYLSCKVSCVNCTDWSECSDSAAPSWNGHPGCNLVTNPWGWQVCTVFGYGQNMKFLANSTAGLQWSEKWQQHYFKVPPFVYKGAAIFSGLPGFPYPDGVNQTVTIWQDDARSLASKYAWAVKEWGGFGVWSTSLVCPLGQYEAIEVSKTEPFHIPCELPDR